MSDPEHEVSAAPTPTGLAMPRPDTSCVRRHARVNMLTPALVLVPRVVAISLPRRCRQKSPLPRERDTVAPGVS
jgi:hypothetical protein